MRKSLIAIGIFTMFSSEAAYLPISTHAQQENSVYAELGRLAIKETRSKYPNAKIIDYLYEGNEMIGNSSIEKYRLWLKRW